MFILPFCIFHRLTGLYCPGCGGTRAVMALFRGDLKASFIYHPLVLYGLAVAIYILIHRMVFEVRSRTCDGFYDKKYVFPTWTLWGALVVLGLNFLIKNLALLILGIDLLKGGLS